MNLFSYKALGIHALLALPILVAQTFTGSAAVYREFYVSPAGSDSAVGSRSHPFNTLARATAAVRSVNRAMTGDIVVYLRAGTYPLSRPLTLGPEDSGFNGHEIIYRGYRNESPVISGGIEVTNWQSHTGGLYRATLNSDSKLRSLYVNGIRATMTHGEFKGLGPWGRFVIFGNEPWAETRGETLDGIRFNSTEMPGFRNAQDIEVLQHRTWNSLIMGVRELETIGADRILKLQQPYGAIAATMAWHCNIAPDRTFTVRNAFELLKNPGEFYFDRTTHTLYYYPRPGEDMGRASVVAPLSEGLLRISGASTNDRAKNITFTGLTFSYDHWLLHRVAESRAMVGVQSLGLYTKFRADGNWHKSQYNICDLPQGTVELRNCANVRLERNRFQHLASGVAVSLVNDVVDSAVVGNAFDDLSGNAVNVGHPQHYVIGDGPLFPARIEGVCARDRIDNNWIRNVSLDFKQEEAISGFFTDSVEITHNDIEGTPYGGIALGWWWGNAEIPASTTCKSNVVAFNRVVDTQQVLRNDGGAIYVLGEQPGSRMENNYVRGSTRLLYPDDGSAFWTIRRNVADLRDVGPDDKPEKKCWLHIWVDRIHDLTITDNFTTSTNVVNKGVRCEPVNTRVENPLSREARVIANAAGLEREYRNIIPSRKSR